MALTAFSADVACHVEDLETLTGGNDTVDADIAHDPISLS